VEPLPDPAHPLTPIDPAAIEHGGIFKVTIDISRLLQNQAADGTAMDPGGLETFGGLADVPSIAPMLGLVSRSIASALGILELTHFRALVLLSERDSLIAAELMALMNMHSQPLMNLLDAMEGAGWIFATMRGRGVNEQVAITERGRAVVEEATRQRQNEIDDILARMSVQDRDTLATAFNAFAAAASESPVTKPKKGIAP